MRQGDPQSSEIRGSGRTRRQLEKLRDGDIFVVGNHGMRRYASDMIMSLEPRRRIRVLVATDPGTNELKGLKPGIWVEVDHDTWEKWRNTQNNRTKSISIGWREAIHYVNSRSGRADPE